MNRNQPDTFANWVYSQFTEQAFLKWSIDKEMPGLEINARKLAKCEWFWQAASEKNILYWLANICELESSMSPKYLEIIC